MYKCEEAQQEDRQNGGFTKKLQKVLNLPIERLNIGRSLQELEFFNGLLAAGTINVNSHVRNRR